MTILTQSDFDSMGCQHPGCDHTSHDGPMFLHPRCHPDAGTWCSYQGGVLEVRCHTCKEPVALIAVDPGDVTRH